MNEKDAQRLAMFDEWMEKNTDANNYVILADEVCELWAAMQEAGVLPDEETA